MIPTCYFRQLETYHVIKGNLVPVEVLQQWWSPVSEDGTPLAPIPEDGLALPGEWRDIPTVAGE